MFSQNDMITDLKLKLLSVTRKKLKNEQLEDSLRVKKRSLTQNISLIKSDAEFMLQQMQELKQQISQAKHQISVIEICSTTEKAKIQSHLGNISAHTKGFDVYFTKERKIIELNNRELQEQEVPFFEMNKQKNKEAAAIETECDSLQRECNVLVKRNEATMLKLRRQLIEAEDTRRELLRKVESNKNI